MILVTSSFLDRFWLILTGYLPTSFVEVKIWHNFVNDPTEFTILPTNLANLSVYFNDLIWWAGDTSRWYVARTLPLPILWQNYR